MEGGREWERDKGIKKGGNKRNEEGDKERKDCKRNKYQVDDPEVSFRHTKFEIVVR